jgi:uncharacterized membrane protein|tara:strand:- start:247 stop:423 length:177 start_codon:yes stop_codon:yes gene_type:complete
MLKIIKIICDVIVFLYALIVAIVFGLLLVGAALCMGCLVPVQEYFKRRKKKKDNFIDV